MYQLYLKIALGHKNTLLVLSLSRDILFTLFVTAEDKLKLPIKLLIFPSKILYFLVKFV